MIQITEQRLKELETREEMYSITTNLLGKQTRRADYMERDIAVLVMRLHGESRDTCSQEVNELLDAYPLEWAMEFITTQDEAEYTAELERGYAKDRI
jgi:hypothetical protein